MEVDPNDNQKAMDFLQQQVGLWVKNAKYGATETMTFRKEMTQF